MSVSSPEYHLTMKKMSALSGASPVASCAYLYGTRLYDEQQARTFSYTTKDEVVYARTSIPAGCDRRYADPQYLWNDVVKDAKRYDARYGTKGDIALPLGWSREEYEKLADDMMQRMFVDRGHPVSYAVHYDKGNVHLHYQTTLKTLTPKGWKSAEKKEYVLDENGQKIPNGYRTAVKKNEVPDYVYTRLINYGSYYLDPTTKAKYTQTPDGWEVRYVKYKMQTIDSNQFKTKAMCRQLRQECAGIINAHIDQRNEALEPSQQQAHVDHRSYAERGIKRVPQVHLGPYVSTMQDLGYAMDLAQENGQVDHTNKALAKQVSHLAVELLPEVLESLKALKNIYEEEIKTGRFLEPIPEERGFFYDDRRGTERDSDTEGYGSLYDRAGAAYQRATRPYKKADDRKRGPEEKELRTRDGASIIVDVGGDRARRIKALHRYADYLDGELKASAQRVQQSADYIRYIRDIDEAHAVEESLKIDFTCDVLIELKAQGVLDGDAVDEILREPHLLEDIVGYAYGEAIDDWRDERFETRPPKPDMVREAVWNLADEVKKGWHKKKIDLSHCQALLSMLDGEKESDRER